MNSYSQSLLKSSRGLPVLLLAGVSVTTLMAQSRPPMDAGRLVDAASPMIQTFPPSGVRDEIVGYDRAAGTLTFVERVPTVVGGFSHVTLVSVGTRDERTRVRLTTDVDLDRLRTQRDPAIFREIDARIVRSINDARGRMAPGTMLPAAEQNASATRCVNAPFATRTFAIGDLGDAQVTPSADGRSTRVQFRRGSSGGNAVDIPSVAVSEPATGRMVWAPYTRVADVRELPSTRQLAVLLRSDVCVPEGTNVAVTAFLIDPPGDQPLPPAEHAELTDSEAMRMIAPRARRRTVDETEGWYERGSRVVYDNAWRIAGASGMLVMQFSRHERNLSPMVAMSGHAHAHFALIDTNGRRPRLVFQFAPSVNSAYEGNSQEAYSADLNGDGRAEIIIRARTNDGSEYITVLRWTEEDLNLAWAGELSVDGRRGGLSHCCAANVVRRCQMGLDGRVLVFRCQHETYAGVGPDARVTQSRLRTERMTYNGGGMTVEINER